MFARLEVGLFDGLLEVVVGLAKGLFVGLAVGVFVVGLAVDLFVGLAVVVRLTVMVCVGSEVGVIEGLECVGWTCHWTNSDKGNVNIRFINLCT